MNTRIILAYERLSESTGFPAVSIAALAAETGLSLTLHRWLLAEHANGNVVFGLGDWSLASLEEREAAIEVRGEKHLLVRLESWSNWRMEGREVLS